MSITTCAQSPDQGFQKRYTYPITTPTMATRRFMGPPTPELSPDPSSAGGEVSAVASPNLVLLNLPPSLFLLPPSMSESNHGSVIVSPFTSDLSLVSESQMSLNSAPMEPSDEHGSDSDTGKFIDDFYQKGFTPHTPGELGVPRITITFAPEGYLPFTLEENQEEQASETSSASLARQSIESEPNIVGCRQPPFDASTPTFISDGPGRSIGKWKLLKEKMLKSPIKRMFLARKGNAQVGKQ